MRFCLVVAALLPAITVLALLPTATALAQEPAPPEIPAAVAARLDRASSLARDGERAAALGELVGALEEDAPPAVRGLIHFNIANLRQQDGGDPNGGDAALADAVEHYRRAVELDPALKDAHFNLAVLLARLGHHRQAARSFAQVLRFDTRDAAARLGRARVLQAAGHDVLARATLEEGVELLPKNADLLDALARLLATSPDFLARDGERAVELARRALGTAPQARYAETLAMALAEAGRFTEAAGVQQQILAQAEAAGAPPAEQQRLAAALALFRQHQPFRAPNP